MKGFMKILGVIFLLAAIVGTIAYITSPVKPWNPFVAVFIVTLGLYGVKLLAQ